MIQNETAIRETRTKGLSMHPRELPVPASALTDPKALELLRVWAAHGNQHVTLATNLWEDPGSWGIMLVDLAKHIARAYEQMNGRNFAETLQRIRQGFDVEWDRPTYEPTGAIQD
jgi:hypothetical protein